MLQALADDLEELDECVDDSKFGSVSLGEAVDAAWGRRIAAVPTDKEALWRSVRTWRERVECASVGCARLADASLAAWADYGDFEGGDIPLPDFGALAEQLARDLCDGRIVCDARVDEIDWNGPDVVATASDGRQWRGRQVVCAVPLPSLLPQDPSGQPQLQFSPPLPTQQAAAAAQIKLGPVAKIFAGFTTPFWDAEWPGYTFLWNEDAEGSESPLPRWARGLYAAQPAAPGVLHMFLTGDDAVAVASADPSEVAAVTTQLLDREPDVVRVVAWCEPGAWSFLPAAVPRDCVQQAAAPLRRRDGSVAVRMVGEATDASHLGSAHGAFMSGVAAAALIADDLQGVGSELP
mmetsp:Transcript_18621/g.44646  ORF Transcript_18621/g.44646 Transcript_18621/m.44646 type:complete len:350 (+) Transcript_18621:98-1147(+)